jgi:hypothetical protein
MDEVTRKLRERRNTLWLPVFSLHGRRYRPRIRWTGYWCKPMQHAQDYGLGRKVWRMWLGPLVMTCLIDNGISEVWLLP